ncbi:hypothetical protein SSP531S_11940 [Streptomyces spongiicola]|uniref:Uncharacterized protein n=1 Tax=Streptomyces spongiicola TaxID=1690221 RepID=A0A388ST35_9ACTN|nr:hypothetical protein SSP531S_11940 [Streptomyces spongiicola]
MQMTQKDGVEVVETDVSLQLAEGAVAHVEQQPEAVGLYEIARAGRFRRRERPRAADDGELHGA